MGEHRKCADCGFLCIKHSKSGKLIEVDRSIRQTGKIPTDRGVVDKSPICLQLAEDLQEEFIGWQKAHDENPFSTVIRQPRKCESFTEWQQGMSPQEHRDMVNQQAIIDLQRRQAEQERRLTEQDIMGRAKHWLHSKALLAWPTVVILVVVFIAAAITQVAGALKVLGIIDD